MEGHLHRKNLKNSAPHETLYQTAFVCVCACGGQKTISGASPQTVFHCHSLSLSKPAELGTQHSFFCLPSTVITSLQCHTGFL